MKTKVSHSILLLMVAGFVISCGKHHEASNEQAGKAKCTGVEGCDPGLATQGGDSTQNRPVPPPTGGHFLAIAFAPDGTGHYGIASGYSDINSAAEASVLACRAAGCAAVAWAKSSCAALAVVRSDKAKGAVSTAFPSLLSAEQDVLRRCREGHQADCVVVVSGCVS